MPEHTEREPTRPERERPEEAAENAEFLEERSGEEPAVGYTSEDAGRQDRDDVERETPPEPAKRRPKNVWEPRGARGDSG